MMGRSRTARLAALACVLAAVAACDRLATNLSGGVGPEAGILRGKLPGDSRGASHAVRLTDGIAASPGDPWRTDLTAVLAAPQSFVTWDLGAETPVRCALIDADGDDTYTLSVSSDGRTFAPLWSAPPDEDAGQQLRAGRDLRGAGRYLRLSAAGGDGRWSVSEVSAWRECPTQWPPLAIQKGTPDDDAVRVKLWAFAALAVAYVLLYRPRAPDWAKLLGVVPAGVGIALAVQLAGLWPPSAALATRLVGVAAVLGVAVALRRIIGRRLSAAPPVAGIALLLGLVCTQVGCGGRSSLDPAGAPACDSVTLADWQVPFAAGFTSIVAADATGASYVATTGSDTATRSVRVTKLDRSAGKIWTNGLGAADAGALATTSAGDLLVGLQLQGTNPSDPNVRFGGSPRSRGAVVRLDAKGNVTWRTELDDDAGDLFPSFVAESTSGDVIAAGTFLPDMAPGQFPNPPVRFAFFLARFSSSGALMWERHLADQGSAQAFVVDALDRVGVAVWLRNGPTVVDGVELSSSLAEGTVIVWLGRDGKAVDARDLTESGDERVTDARIDASGRLYLAGALGHDQLGASFTSEVFVSAFDGGQPHVWNQRFSLGTQDEDARVSLDPCGRVVVVDNPGNVQGFLVVRLTRDGAIDARRAVSPSVGSNVTSTVAANGGLYVAGMGGDNLQTGFVASLGL